MFFKGAGFKTRPIYFVSFGSASLVRWCAGLGQVLLFQPDPESDKKTLEYEASWKGKLQGVTARLRREDEGRVSCGFGFKK